MPQDITKLSTYRVFDDGAYRLGNDDSLQGAVRIVAQAWHCPFEALHTEQDSATLWRVVGPEGQECGSIELAERP